MIYFALTTFIYIPVIALIVIVFSLLLLRKSKSVTTYPAKIIDKRIDSKVSYCGVGANPPGTALNTYVDYYVTFQLDAIKALELRVSEEVFESLQRDDEGELDYLGIHFNSFTKNSS